jgi:serine/threonine protein kinase
MREPTPIHEVRPEVPRELSDILHRLLRKKPEERYQHPTELLEALAPFVPAEVPLPDSAWFPDRTGRVAARLATNPGPASFAGSASQVLVAALRSNPPSFAGPPSSGIRPQPRPAAPTTSSLSFEETEPAAPRPQPPSVVAATVYAPPPSPPTAPYVRLIILILSAALFLALVTIIILLLFR